MSEFVFRLPDLGEGTVEAEIVEWHVAPGDEVVEGQIIADVMTDKANVEVPAPVSGRVLRVSGGAGDMVQVGAELIAIEVQKGAAAPAPEATPQLVVATRDSTPEPVAVEEAPAKPAAEPAPAAQAPVETGETESSSRVITSPAVRKRAKEAGVDLQQVLGTGPRGRILASDLERHLTGQAAAATPAQTATAAADEYQEIKVIGVRRVIAERLTQSKREIPHFAYVEEVDVTELEALRQRLNQAHERDLSILPFVAMSLVRALRDFPQCNAQYDAAGNLLRRFSSVHLGVATQTPDGLKVPVVRHAQQLSLWQLVAAIGDLATRARDGSVKASELSGSTITLTSLGKLGGIVSTPIINYPEVAIIGINRAVKRAVVVDDEVRIRTMMNLSSSFDHRFVDGYDAAAMINQMKDYLQHPAMLFLDAPG